MADGATYHWNLKTVSRGQGASAIGKAAYQSGTRLDDPRRAEPHDYRRKARGVVATGIVLPDGAPAELRDRQTLWQSAEAAERHPRAVTARRLIVALPCALDDDARRALVTDYAAWLATEYGVAVDYAVHQPHRKHRATPDAAEVPGGDPRNFHAHLLLTTRRVTADGLGPKTRELDDRKTGAVHIERMRAEWASLINARLAAAGAAARVDHRSKERIGAERGEPAEPPAPQLTPGELAQERAGRRTRRGEQWRRTREDQKQHRQDRGELRSTRRKLRAAERDVTALRAAEDEAQSRFAGAVPGPDTPPRLPTPHPQEDKPMLDLLIPDPAAAQRRIAELDAKRLADARDLRRSPAQRQWRKDLTAYLAELAAPGPSAEPVAAAFASLMAGARAMHGLTGAVAERVAYRVRRTVAVAAPGLLNIHDRFEQMALSTYLAGDAAGRRAAARITRRLTGGPR